MDDISTIIAALVDFRNARNWEQFHNPKDLPLALSIEAAELNELFLWKKYHQLDSVDIDRVKEELADVFAYAFMLAEKYDFDVKEIVLKKIEKNGQKYPVEKSRNVAEKYDRLK
jgi:NTP pyrophosphatase (non-canonical NTP hydrolase)